MSLNLEGRLIDTYINMQLAGNLPRGVTEQDCLTLRNDGVEKANSGDTQKAQDKFDELRHMASAWFAQETIYDSGKNKRAALVLKAEAVIYPDRIVDGRFMRYNIQPKLPLAERQQNKAQLPR